MAILLAGCSPGHAQSPRTATHITATDGPTQATAEVQVQRRPLDVYHFTRAEHQTILTALQILEEQCMAEYGFRLREADAPYGPTIEPEYPQAELFAIADAAQGYGIPTTPEMAAAEERDQANNVYLNNLPEASEAYTLVESGRYKRTDEGVPASIPDAVGGKAVYPTGCEGRAWDAIAPDDTTEGTPLWVKDLDPWDAAEADPRSRQVIDAWSACMAQDGYQYARPEDITFALGTDTTLDHGKEVTIAKADDACRKSTDYAQVRFEVLSEYDRKVIEEHQVEFSGLRARYDAEVRRAADVVTGSGGAQ